MHDPGPEALTDHPAVSRRAQKHWLFRFRRTAQNQPKTTAADFFSTLLVGGRWPLSLLASMTRWADVAGDFLVAVEFELEETAALGERTQVGGVALNLGEGHVGVDNAQGAVGGDAVDARTLGC